MVIARFSSFSSVGTESSPSTFLHLVKVSHPLLLYALDLEGHEDIARCEEQIGCATAVLKPLTRLSDIESRHFQFPLTTVLSTNIIVNSGT